MTGEFCGSIHTTKLDDSDDEVMTVNNISDDSSAEEEDKPEVVSYDPPVYGMDSFDI